ncbi:BQ2448_8068 [Microbotryum intermedium]|uniref:BQ2448_8068 protein n=1 Tax=Microbotryum intermedium TaxID=269621 RepID=A0A238FNR6_9BASI|nr:BQ2448_8068 [Microbotryum intermedium]
MSPPRQDVSSRRMTRNSNPDKLPPGLVNGRPPMAAAVDMQAIAPIESTSGPDGGGEGDDSASVTTSSIISKRSTNKRQSATNTTASKKTASKKTAKSQSGPKQQSFQQPEPPSSTIASADRTQSLARSATSANSHRPTSLQAHGGIDENSPLGEWEKDGMPSSDEPTSSSSDDPNDEPYLPSQKRGPSGATSASKRRRKAAAPVKATRKSTPHAQADRPDENPIFSFNHSSTRALGAFPALRSLTDNVEAVIRAARAQNHFRTGLQAESHQRLKASIEALPNPPQRHVLALLLNRYTSFCETQEADVPAFPLSVSSSSASNVGEISLMHLHAFPVLDDQPAKVAIFLARATDTPFGERLRRRFPQPSTYPLPIAGRDDQGSLLGLSEGSRVDLALIRCWLQAFCYAQGAIAPVWGPALPPFDFSLASIARDAAIIDIVATFQQLEGWTPSLHRTKLTAMGNGSSQIALQTSQATAGSVDSVMRPPSQDIEAAEARTAQRASAMTPLSQAISEHNARAAKRGSTANVRPRDAGTSMMSLFPQLATGNHVPIFEMTHRPQNSPVGMAQSLPDHSWTPPSSIAARPWPLSNYGAHPLPIEPEMPIKHQASNFAAQVGSTTPSLSANLTQPEPHLRSATAASSLSDFQQMSSETAQVRNTPHLFDELRTEHHEMGSTPRSSQSDASNDAAPNARGSVRQAGTPHARWQNLPRPPRVGMLLSDQIGDERRNKYIGPETLHQSDVTHNANIVPFSFSPFMMPPPPSPSPMSEFARRGSMVQSTPYWAPSSTPMSHHQVSHSITTASLPYGTGTQADVDNSSRRSARPSAPTLIALPADVRPVGWFVEVGTMRTIQIGCPQVTPSNPSSYSGGMMPPSGSHAPTPNYQASSYFSTPVARPFAIRQRESEPRPTAGPAGEIATNTHAKHVYTSENETNQLPRPSPTLGSARLEQHRSSLHAGLESSTDLGGTFLLDDVATAATCLPRTDHGNSNLISATPINDAEPRTSLNPASPSNARPVDSPIYRESPLSLKEVSRAHST